MYAIGFDPRMSADAVRRAAHQVDRPGHSLTIDSGWREVYDTALSFVRRFA